MYHDGWKWSTRVAAMRMDGPRAALVQLAANQTIGGVNFGDRRLDFTAPQALSWSSVLTHLRGVGEVGLVISPDDLFSEPRDQGVRKIVVTFSEAVASFGPANVLLAGNGIAGVLDLSAY